MRRFRTNVTLTIEYDADDGKDARKVADQLASTASVPTPLGRGAELTKTRATVVSL